MYIYYCTIVNLSMIKLPPNFKKNIFYILCSSYKTDLHKFHEIYFFSFAQVIICYEKKNHLE